MDEMTPTNISNSYKEFLIHDGSLKIFATTEECSRSEVDGIIEKLDISRGVILTSRYEYPGRYTRYDLGFVNPPIVLEVIQNNIFIKSLNSRGDILLKVFYSILENCEMLNIEKYDNGIIVGQILDNKVSFFEEDRSKSAHVLNILRFLRNALSIDDNHIGFYGAFGYDLGLDFMGVTKTMPRDNTRDLVLYFADQVFVTDHEKNTSIKYSYDFEYIKTNESTVSLPREGMPSPYTAEENFKASQEVSADEYEDIVKQAKEYFARGDLFEVVPSYSFNEPCNSLPSVIFNTLLNVNPAPYGALINLGDNEFTISASPEMFVRVEGQNVESCPIAGTIARGTQGVSDAEQIEKLLMSEKEDSELIMCTDVDRNDKSRVSVPGSVEVIGRRQIEIYSRLIHTVDHVQGTLLEKYDAIDAFLTHMWAVTVTGAPKMWACKFIEKHEHSSRRFYGGAMGAYMLDGSMNTGLMLRSVHLHSGAAHIRVGATLLTDSDPQEETKETVLKASAMLDVVRHCHNKMNLEEIEMETLSEDLAKGFVLKDKTGSDLNKKDSNIGLENQNTSELNRRSGDKKQVLLIDCEDSFVNTLASYFRMVNCEVKTIRIGFTMEEFTKLITDFKPDLVCLSPGPGSPTDFGLDEIIAKLRELSIPIFGVCLGLQAIVEHFGGTLGQLDTPMHGKKSKMEIVDTQSKIFKNIESPFEAGRYHSLYANRETFPNDDLKIVAQTVDDHIIMGLEHRNENICAVQFHPESIMTFDKNVGISILIEVLESFAL